jgi:acetoacetyl-CoA synthetase
MKAKEAAESAPLWKPSRQVVEGANVTRFTRWLSERRGLRFETYDELWAWSVTELEAFWESVWQFFGVRGSAPYREVLAERRMPGARWFSGATLNYAEHVFRGNDRDGTALLFQSEQQALTAIGWKELEEKVARVAGWLRRSGIGRGDRVVSYLPNIPEAIVAFLATASVGAIWSICSPDFGTRSVIDRFRQIEPKVLFAADGYRYGGKLFDRRSEVAELQRALPTLKATVLVPYVLPDSPWPELAAAVPWAATQQEAGRLVYEQVAFDHPLWVVYSSGTTGLPKALVHGHGGVLLELLKFLGLHLDLHGGDRFFWFSTTGWIMWNLLQGGLLLGATPILFDGNPGHPSPDVLWDLAEKTGTTFFGAGAPFLTSCMRAGLEPGTSHDLVRLRGIGSTGSPLPPETFHWVYEHVKRDVWLASVSGGTDVSSGLLGSCPLLPVRAGELQCRCLGVKVESFDDQGHPVIDQPGELVITAPMPSMPLYLWNDPEGARCAESYFEMYPNVWRHGDWVELTSRGSAVIVGRSDATLKRMGVRMGSGDFYSALETLPEIADSLIVGYDTPEGAYFMPLFVVVRDGGVLDEVLRQKIVEKIRTALSPRHLPDEIYAVRELPRTLNGKKLEVPVKKVLMGFPVERAVNRDSMVNPQAMAYFVTLAKELAARATR